MSSVQVYNDQKKTIAEQIWLHYYNKLLFEKGIITEEERNRMTNRINARNSMAGSKQIKAYPVDIFMPR